MVELVFSLRAFLPLCFHLPLPLFSPPFLSPPFSTSLWFVPIASVCLHIYFSLQVGRQSTPSKMISPIYIYIHYSLLISSPRGDCLLLFFINSFPSIPPRVIPPPTHPSLDSLPFLLATPRLVLFCRNDKAAGGRDSGHN